MSVNRACGQVPVVVPSVLLVVILLFSGPVEPQTSAANAAQPDAAERCHDAKYRQFDFWVGEWEVRNAEGQLVGRNSVRSVSRGCALLEDWHGASGSRGMSINTYDTDIGAWTQRWVGAGATLWLQGGLDEGRMVLTGTAPRSTPHGKVLDRVTWTLLPDGGVSQSWEISSDDGKNWREFFVGFYSAVETAGIQLLPRQRGASQ